MTSPDFPEGNPVSDDAGEPTDTPTEHPKSMVLKPGIVLNDSSTGGDMTTEELAARLGIPWPDGDEPKIDVKAKPTGRPWPEFETRQELADALHGDSAYTLVRDGYSSDELPLDDDEIRAAYIAVEGAVADLDTVVMRFADLLPESAQAKNRREQREIECQRGKGVENNG